MKNMKQNFATVQSTIKYWCFCLLGLGLSISAYAQVPQNIEVEGEPEQGWQYLLYVVALLIVLAVIFLILRIVKGAKKSDK